MCIQPVGSGAVCGLPTWWFSSPLPLMSSNVRPVVRGGTSTRSNDPEARLLAVGLEIIGDGHMEQHDIPAWLSAAALRKGLLSSCARPRN